MATKSRRKEPRFSTRIPVRLIWDRRTYVGMTEDVSFSGMRIRSDAMPPLRLLVRIELTLPDSGQRLGMHAFVAHATLDPSCGQPSVGLQLYGVSEEERAVWQAYVQELRDANAPARAASSAVLVIDQLASELGALPALIERGGSVFCETNLAFQSGQAVHLALIHPVTRQLHLLAGRVAMPVDGHRRGVAVMLAPLSKAELLKLVLFVRPEGALAASHDKTGTVRAA